MVVSHKPMFHHILLCNYGIYVSPLTSQFIMLLLWSKSDFLFRFSNNRRQWSFKLAFQLLFLFKWRGWNLIVFLGEENAQYLILFKNVKHHNLIVNVPSRKFNLLKVKRDTFSEQILEPPNAERTKETDPVWNREKYSCSLEDQKHIICTARTVPSDQRVMSITLKRPKIISNKQRSTTKKATLLHRINICHGGATKRAIPLHIQFFHTFTVHLKMWMN